MHKGGCDCGGVQFQIDGPVSDITVCPCGQCRRISGYAWASVRAAPQDLRFVQQDRLVWRASSDWAERGFCSGCGAALFYRMPDKPDRISVAAGSLEQPVGAEVRRHIFVKDKADFMEIGGSAEQIARF